MSTATNPATRKSKAWREANPERHRDYQRRYHLKKKFGITLEDYERMLDGQGGRCAICRKPPERAATTRGDYLFVDHDHVTDKVRGLLCHHCNALLGHSEDSPQVLRCALHYLEATTYATGPVD